MTTRPNMALYFFALYGVTLAQVLMHLHSGVPV